ncbi:hypothetical protein FOCG_17756 [Fusarium oxysporum f. sp. radicis-lycopersici 26381]|nr:hypothetical protein FOCG_17756 [Fusarium oxysporum f. sp. radicis-lycopersici 26381]
MLFAIFSLSLAGLTGLAGASPLSLPSTSQDLPSRHIHGDEMHARALAHHPKDLVIDSKDLHDFMKNAAGSDAVVYLQDERVYVPMSNVSLLDTTEDKNDAHDSKPKRQIAAPCYAYNQWQARDAKSWWSPWETASGCLYTGLSDGTGVYGLTWSKSVAVEVRGGLDFSAVKDLLGISVGVSVTNTWTDGGRIDCQIPAHSVGQIWVQKYLGEANMWSMTCQSCGISGTKCIGDWVERGYVKAPSDGSDLSKNVNTGCSTGYDKVQC